MVINKINRDFVSAVNSTNNNYYRDVIGNKQDYIVLPFVDHTNSIMAHLNTSYKHIHGTAFIFPNLADSVVVTKSTSAWTYGNAVQVIAAGDTANAFDLHFAVVSDISAVGQFQVQILSNGTPISSFVFSRSAVFSQEQHIPVQIPQQAAGSVITIKLAGNGTNATTCGIKFAGHYY